MTGPHACGICNRQLSYHTAQDTYSCSVCRVTITAEALQRRNLGEKPFFMREYRDTRPDGTPLQHWSQVVPDGKYPFDQEVPSYLGEWRREVREFLSDGSWATSWQTVITSHENDLVPAVLQPGEYVLPSSFSQGLMQIVETEPLLNFKYAMSNYAISAAYCKAQFEKLSNVLGSLNN